MLTLDAFRSREELPSLLLAGATVTVVLVLTAGPAMFTALLLFVGLLLARTSPRPGRSPMPSTSYLIAVPAIVFTITLVLRAVPFAMLGRLRDSAIVARPAVWMPVGILAIPAVTALHGSVTTDPHGAWYAPLAVAVTIGVHLACGRRTILGVGAGTAVYAVMPNTL
ncbi:branched-chain amino acid transporter permease [Streptomyces hokutonensis]|uniref:branched-chain amino acid transporter permease n=1 Tax=Streptomyces hokutonensis TaxID=1306990 RepID=UPI0003612621|nr:AzlD domain-containing protein [Streptomyces hokutonensis]